MVKFKRCLDFSFYFISVIGIVYQVFRQSSVYFEYPVYSVLDHFHRSIRLPAITFCVSYWYSEVQQQLEEKTVMQARQLFPSFSDIVVNCSVVLPNGSITSCLSVSKVNRYMNANMACHSLFEEQSTFLTDEELTYHQPLDTDFLFDVLLQSPINFSNHWGLSVRPHDSPLTIFRSTESKIWIEPLVDSLTAAALSVSRRIELPDPYMSRCFDYSQTPWKDLDNTLQRCWIEKFNQNAPTLWPKWALYDFNGHYSIDLNKVHFAHGSTSAALFPDINEYCFNKYLRAECVKETFFLRSVLFHKNTQPLRDNNYTLRVVDVPQTYDTITLQPRILFSSLINDIGNIMSMWIGVAAYFSSIHLVDHIIRINQPIKVINIPPGTQKTTPHTVKSIKYANFIIQFVFLLITFYFIQEIILIYFENPFFILLLSTVPSYTQLSHLTICFNISLNGDLTINQLLDTTLDWDKLFIPSESTFVSSETRRYEKIINYWNFTKSLDGDDVCVTSFGSENYINGTQVPPYLQSLMLTAKTIDVKLNVSSLFSFSTIKIFYHRHPRYEESVSAQNQIIIPINKDNRLHVNSYLLAPSMTKIELYPDHIRSDCFDYKETFNVSCRLEAVQKCTVDTFVSRYNLWPLGYRTESSELKFDVSHKHSVALRQIRDECEKHFPRLDCVTELATLTVAGNFIHPNYTSLIIYPMRKFLPLFQQQIKYTVVDIIGFIGGTLNSWMGLTAIDIFKSIHRLRVSIIHKFRVRNKS